MPQHVTRRSFIAMAGLGVAGTAWGRPRFRTSPRWASTAPTASERLLVVVDLAGGNDGFSMAPPTDLGALAAVRPDTSWSEDEMIRLDGGVSLHPALSRLSTHPIGVVDGLGTARPDLSHFEMLRRWWVGDPDGTADLTTGFLGRLCDELDVGAPATGVSIGAASSPALVSARSGTIGLPAPGWLWWLEADAEDEWSRDLATGLTDLATNPGPDHPGDELPTVGLARANLAAGLRVGRELAALPAASSYPDSSLGAALGLARRLIDADLGVRIIHVAGGGDYDTHRDHRDSYDRLMADLDAAVGTFLDDLAAGGLGERVLVATTSEFGRRLDQNDSAGLDHGTASVALLAGPVHPGRFGEPPALDRLDDNGNVVATTSMTDYYATIAEGWFGVPAAQVVASGQVLPGLFT